MKFDKIYINGNIITVDPENPRAKWVAIKDGKIAAVGMDQAPVAQAAKTVDLAGKTMLPGLIDSHAHGTTTGWGMNSANVVFATNVQEVIDALAEEVKKAGPGMNGYSVQA